jgi:hypothetical protein
MMSERASIFDDSADFDISGFAPKKKERAGEASREAVRVVSEASSFPSREPAPAAKPAGRQPDTPKREPRRYRTGRNVQLNIKVRAETLDSFYTIADRQGWVLGETLEKAVSALEKELARASATS